MKTVILVAASGLLAVGAGGCRAWPRVEASPLPKAGGQYSGAKDFTADPQRKAGSKFVAAPALTGLRHVHDPRDPSHDATLVRLEYANGNKMNLLLGGTELDISPLLSGSGVVLTQGWAYVHGDFPAHARLTDPKAWGIWPIVVRSTVAAGAEGTSFIVDCRQADSVVVTAVKNKNGAGVSKVSLWDLSNPAAPKPLPDPVTGASTSKFVLDQDNFDAVKFIGGRPVPETPKPLSSDPAYMKWVQDVLTLADEYDADEL
ncbi:MAG: hypothetical protein U0637_12680 [Phycisphaerales bacterium]